MSLKFKSYTDIENTTNKKKYDELCKYGYDTKEWIALEKVHGSNFSFLCDGRVVNVAKRSSIIPVDEIFYKSDELQKIYEKDIMTIFKKISSDNPDVSMIQIFGEVFGGNYKDIISKSRSKAVQKGVYYNPEIDFIVFDIRIDSYNPDEIGYYLSHNEVMKYCNINEVNLIVLTPLHKGNLETMLKLNPVFESTIHKLYNLPQIPNNYAEGYVLKVNERHTLKYDRPILKHKNMAFGEVKQDLSVSNVNTADIMTKHFTNLLNYICENRFDNLISKEGADSNYEKLVNLFAIDCVKDYIKTLEPDQENEFKLIDKIIKKNLAQHIKQNKIIDEYLKKHQ